MPGKEGEVEGTTQTALSFPHNEKEHLTVTYRHERASIHSRCHDL